mgnify:CR=1 FL=1
MGYIFGCIQTSYLLGKFKFGVDVKQQGSKNAGASNSVLLFGWGFGIFVGFIDMLKAYLPMLIISLIYSDSNDTFFIASLAGGGAILGHIFPFFMNFNGGKGMSCYFGMLFFFDFFFGLIVSVSSVILLMITNYVAVATIITLIFVPLFFHFFCDYTFNFILSMSFLSLFIIVKHRGNIFRIIKGTETTFWSAIKK